MQDGIDPTRLIRSQRARLLAAMALTSGVLLAGCGGSSGSPTVAAVNTTSTSTSSTASGGAATTSRSSTATGDGAAGSGSTAPSSPDAVALAYARCMRANGVPNFPDPAPG